jgi:tetratricopeptide (TPR) repeat protein
MERSKDQPEPAQAEESETRPGPRPAETGPGTLSLGESLSTAEAGSSRHEAASPPLFQAGELAAGRYRVTRFIARGGMGEVYAAEDLELGGAVALKTIRPSLARDERGLERFRREIYLSRRVTHPNVCRIFDLFRHRKRGAEPGAPELEIRFLTMELLEGETLADLLRRRGRMRPAQALPLVRQMAAALEAAHAAGVVHRDFKSRNVMLIRAAGGERPAQGPAPAGSEDGWRVVVTDFGLANVHSEDDSGSLTASGDMLGTPAYMAPEQVEGGEIGPAADLYALGVVMYEMITGSKPFVGDTPLATAVRRLAEPPIPPRRLVPGLDPRWDEAILRCLERSAQDRFATALEVVRALEGERVASPRRVARRRRLAAAALAVALAAGATGAALLSGGGGGPDVSGPASSRRAVAVLGFKNLSGDPRADWLSTALSEMLGTELAAGARLRVVPGEGVSRMKLELGLSEAESLASDTLARIREHLGVDYLVLGSTIALGSGAARPLRVDVRLQDTARQETVYTLTESGTETELFDLVSRIGARLRQRLGVGGLSQAEAAGALAQMPADPEAARLYSEGLSRLRQFDARGALELLEKAAAAEPGRALPHAALAAAWSALGHDEQARAEARRAHELSEGLPREQKLAVEGRYREMLGEWDEAVRIYRVLWGFFPDSREYGLLLARAQSSAGRGKEALATVEALRRLPPPDGEDPTLDLAEAEAAEALSDYERQRAAAARAVEKGHGRGARLLVAQGRVWEGLALWNLGEPDAAASAYEEARRLYAEAGDSGGAARVLRLLAYTLAHRGRLAEAQAMYETALASFREIGDRRGIQWAQSGLALLLQDQGELARARELLEEALAASREAGDRPAVARALQNLAGVLAAEGRLAEARARAEESLDLFRRIGDQRGEAWARLRLGEAALHKGELSRAEALLGAALGTFRQIGNKNGAAWALGLLGEVQAAQGRLEAARQGLAEALELRQRLDEKGFLAETRLALAAVELAEGRAAEAAEAAADAAEALGLAGRRPVQARALALAARARLEQGDRAGAIEAGGRAAELGGASQAPGVRLEARIAVARVQAGSGLQADLAEARAELERALAEAEALGLAGPEFEARLALGQIEARAGQAEAGRARLEALRRETEARGYVLFARQAEAALRPEPSPSPID